MYVWAWEELADDGGDAGGEGRSVGVNVGVGEERWGQNEGVSV